MRERLDPETLGKRGDQCDPRLADHPLIVEDDLNTVQSDGFVILHLQADLLTPGPGRRHSPKKPCSGGHSCSGTGRNRPTAAVDPG
jgi:hypothetical protein